MIDILIPNYNGKHLLATCLDSILPQLNPDDLITIIDNGSQDGSVAFLREKYPRINLVLHSDNRGFSAAINAGIAATRQPFIFLLNNDTELESDCLPSLMQVVAQRREYEFFALKMLSYNERNMLDGAGDGFFRGGMGYRLGTMEEDGPCYNKGKQVFGACAGAALYRRSFFDRVGLFDEDFFAYLEDVDINLRANRLGMRCFFVPEARVYHIGSATTGSTFNPLTIKLTTRNSLNVLVKNYPGTLFLSFLPMIIIYQFFWFLFVVKKKHLTAYFTGIASFIKNWRKTVRKRSSCQPKGGLTNTELAQVLTVAECDVICSLMQRRLAQGKNNWLLRLYRQIFISSASCDG